MQAFRLSRSSIRRLSTTRSLLSDCTLSDSLLDLHRTDRSARHTLCRSCRRSASDPLSVPLCRRDRPCQRRFAVPCNSLSSSRTVRDLDQDTLHDRLRQRVLSCMTACRSHRTSRPVFLRSRFPEFQKLSRSGASACSPA